jgi:hypothetical protein
MGGEEMSRRENCPACGLPRSLNRKLIWTTDGGIYFQSKHSDRLLFLEEEDVSTIIGEAVKLRGDDILDRLRDVRRDFTRAAVSSQIAGMRRAFFRHWPLAKRIVRSAFQDAAFFGCGDINISKISPRKQMIVKARHPYHPHLLAGDIWGFWEGLYGVEAELALNAPSDLECDITVTTKQKRKRKASEDKTPERPKRDYDLEVCEKCHIPLFPWELRWDTELGTIYLAGTHRHMTITSAQGWRLILNEIKRTMGEEYPAIMSEALSEKATAKYRLIKDDNYKTAYRHFFLGLPFLGWGKPSKVARKPFLVEADMEGVPFPQLLAWKIEGAYQALENEPGDMEYYKTGSEKWQYLIGPRLDGTFLEIDKFKPTGIQNTYPRPFLTF